MARLVQSHNRTVLPRLLDVAVVRAEVSAPRLTSVMEQLTPVCNNLQQATNHSATSVRMVEQFLSLEAPKLHRASADLQSAIQTLLDVKERIAKIKNAMQQVVETDTVLSWPRLLDNLTDAQLSVAGLSPTQRSAPPRLTTSTAAAATGAAIATAAAAVREALPTLLPVALAPTSPIISPDRSEAEGAAAAAAAAEGAGAGAGAGAGVEAQAEVTGPQCLYSRAPGHTRLRPTAAPVTALAPPPAWALPRTHDLAEVREVAVRKVNAFNNTDIFNNLIFITAPETNFDELAAAAATAAAEAETLAWLPGAEAYRAAAAAAAAEVARQSRAAAVAAAAASATWQWPALRGWIEAPERRAAERAAETESQRMLREVLRNAPTTATLLAEDVEEAFSPQNDVLGQVTAILDEDAVLLTPESKSSDESELIDSEHENVEIVVEKPKEETTPRIDLLDDESSDLISTGDAMEYLASSSESEIEADNSTLAVISQPKREFWETGTLILTDPLAKHRSGKRLRYELRSDALQKILSTHRHQCSACERRLDLTFNPPFIDHYTGLPYCHACAGTPAKVVIPALALAHQCFDELPVLARVGRYVRDLLSVPLIPLSQAVSSLRQRFSSSDVEQWCRQRGYVALVGHYLLSCPSKASVIRQVVPGLNYLLDRRVTSKFTSITELKHVVEQRRLFSEYYSAALKAGAAHVRGCSACLSLALPCPTCRAKVFLFDPECVPCRHCHALYHRGCMPQEKNCVVCRDRALQSKLAGIISEQTSPQDKLTALKNAELNL